jgi:hypothetical protein
MVRKLRAFGLLATAVVAMGAIAVSDASAQEGVLTSDGPVTLDMAPVGEAGANTLRLPEGIECVNTGFTGHKYNVTPHEPLAASGATTITVTPNYKVPCAGPPQTFAFNGCDYVMHIGQTVAENQYAVTFDTVCPIGKDIEIHIYSSSSHLLQICNLTIKPQFGLTGVTATTNPATDDLSIAGTLSVQVEKSGMCGIESTVAEHKMNFTVEGTSNIGKTTGITITD